MGFMDWIGNAARDVYSDVLKPAANFGANLGSQYVGGIMGSLQNLTGGLGQGFAGLGQGLGQIGRGIGDMITSPVFLLAVGGVVLYVVVKK
jgi:hypothetical protein